MSNESSESVVESSHSPRAQADRIDSVAEAGRWEILRALGSLADPMSSPADRVSEALFLPRLDPAEHTEVFVMCCPPYASIYLGEEGKLGGESADRVAGFWRVLGLSPPAEPDHLGTELALYAYLGEAETESRHDHTKGQLRAVRESLLWEHLWSWVPGYLTAVSEIATTSLSPWAVLLLRALHAEALLATPAPVLPFALRSANDPVDIQSASAILDSAIVPLSSGMVLTRHAIRRAAATIGVGYRHGERRFALRSMLEQDPLATTRWLGDEARRWATRHQSQPAVPGADPRAWWTDRAHQTANALCGLANKTP